MIKLNDIVKIEDFADRIPGILEGMEIATFAPYFRQLLDGPLGKVLPVLHLFWESTTYTDTPQFKLVRESLVPYLVYAIYARYILQGSFTATIVGAREKDSDYGNVLTPEQRAALARTWNDTALPFLNEVIAILEPPTNCKGSGRIIEARFSTIVGRNTSKFNFD